MTVTIRDAAATDADALAPLLAELGYAVPAGDVPARLRALAASDSALLVAESADGTLAGVMGLHRYPVIHAPTPNAYITALVTTSAARGTGVGRALVRAAEAWARAHGCGRLTVTSAEHRADAHAFYPACGLPYTGRRFSKKLETG